MKMNSLIDRDPVLKKKSREVGFQYLSSILADINECSQEPCLGVENTVCENAEGSYKCECVEGFRKSADGSTCEGKKKSQQNFSLLIKCCFGGIKR